MKFEKPSISIPDQIALLKSRGMTVDDEAHAEHYLRFISYYRLRAYWLPFEEAKTDDGDHTFRDGTKFNDVLTLYIFDRELRLLVLDAIERVEIALRAQWAHCMAMTHGPHGYLEQGHYADSVRHSIAVKELKKEFRRSCDAFAKHYRNKYANPELPPVWMAVEVISFGLLSKFFSNLKLRAERQKIAKPFGLDEKVVVSFAHHMSHVRNICAHHGRLWNKHFTIKMTVPNYPAKLPVTMRGADARALHDTLVMLDYLLSIIAPGNEWRKHVLELIENCSLADTTRMGFPDNWRTRPSWRRA